MTVRRHKPLFEGAEWDFQILKNTYEAIEEIALNDLGLNVYPNQVEASQSWEFDQSVDEVIQLGVEGISLETCFMPGFDADYLARLKDKLDQHQLERVLAWGHPDGLEGGENRAAACRKQRNQSAVPHDLAIGFFVRCSVEFPQ